MSSFIAQDLHFLRQWYNVEILSLYQFHHGHFDALFSFHVWKMVARCDAVFGWFGGCAPIVIMASILRKPSVVVAGGADIVHVPEIGYGLNPKNKIYFYAMILGYRLARKVLLFSESSRIAFVDLPKVNTAAGKTVYLGVDSEYFKPLEKKQPHVLTISYISENGLRRKGVYTLIETARLTPEINYRVAGLIVQQDVIKKLIDSAPSNVKFLGFLENNQLLHELQTAKIYAQLSFHEGFGLAVAEAMACECIPVVTDRGSLPEVVGDTGRYVPVDDPVATAKAIRDLLSRDDPSLGVKARRRVVDLFKIANRESEIASVMKEFI
jgi:glycosyltransferase involved in cell wall biosynthesis